jgi:outer membrane receptor protein involved in Fe transport
MASRWRTVVFAAWLLLGVSASLVMAQVTGSIAGTIRDESGAVLPGVTVTLTGPSLQRESVVVTSAADGTYRIPLVPPGTYRVAMTLSGFTAHQRDAVGVAVNQQTTVDVTLGVGALAETIQVSGDAPLIQVARADVTNIVTQATIDALPLNGRNYTDLLALVAGAKPNPDPSGSNIAIFGERAGAVSYLVDGAENNDPVNGGALLRFTQDAIKEFEVITTGYEAEFGRAQGGIANIVTRSGTDALTGRGFWFVRNDKLDSSNIPDPSPLPAGYVAPAPPKLDRHQWGGTLGGPIVKDKAFFFGSFEKLNETRGVNFDLTKIPAFVRSGIATPSGVENFGVAPTRDGFTGLFKVDGNLSQNHRLTGSFNRSTQNDEGLLANPLTAGTLALPSAAATRAQPASSVILRETAVLRKSLFLESTADYVRGETGNNLDQSKRSEPLLLLLRSGFLQTGAPSGGKTDQLSERYQVAQSLSYFVAGRGGEHQFKFGWDLNRIGLTGYSQVTNDVEYSPGYSSPDPAAPFARAFALYGFQQSAARFFFLSSRPDGSLNLDVKTTDTSLYAQDRWRLSSRLSVNAGIRYDYSSLFGDYKKAFGPRLGVAWDLAGSHTTILKADVGLFYDRNLLAAAATVPEKGGVFTKSVFDVALPRLGVDYTDSLIDYVISSGFPTAGGGFGPAENPLYRGFATDLRNDSLASYKLLGIPVADPARAPVVTSDNIQQLSGKTADQALAILKATYPGTDFRFFDVPGGSIVGDRVLSFFPRGPLEVTRTVSRYSQDLVPHTTAFSGGVDQQIGPNLSLSAMYVHRRSRDLLTRRITNLFDASRGDATFGLTTDGGPQLSQVTYDGVVDYDGLILSLRGGFGTRYHLGLSYTASRARDNLLTGQVGSTFSNNNHPELDYGPSNQSAPQIFVGNTTVMLPYDLNLSAILFWRSGAAFNPRGLVDSDGDGLVDQRDLTQPRNEFRIKSYGDLDLRLEKKVTFGKQAVSVLIEAFNVLNRDNVANVNSVAGLQFGTPATYLPGREVQFGIRYFFGQQ